MSEHLPKLIIFFKACLVLVVIFLVIGFGVLLYEVRKIESLVVATPIFPSNLYTNQSTTALNNAIKDYCDSACQKMIQDKINNAVATIAASLANLPKTQVTQTTKVNQTKQTSFVSLGSSGSTNNTNWTDVAGTGVYIDLKNDYSEGAYVTWDAFLSSGNGSGKAYARLYDATHNIAVDGSELTSSSAALTQMFSGSLNLWAGKNLYKVQIKSLDSNTATFGSGRIKIVY